MSRGSWGSLGGSVGGASRPWVDQGRATGYSTDHPEPTDPERIALLVADAFAQVFPSLARADPGRVEKFQIAVEAALTGKNWRERRGRKSS